MKQSAIGQNQANQVRSPNVQIKTDLKRYQQQTATVSGVVSDTYQHHFSTNTITVGQKVVSIAAANKKRRYLLIQNTGLNGVYISFGDSPVFNKRGIFLAAGNVLEFANGVVPNNEIQAVCTPTTKLVICEGNVLL